MNADVFKVFVRDMRRSWLPSEGLVVEATTRGKQETDVRISGSRSMNSGLVMEACMVWNGDDLEYSGLVGTDDMKHVLQRLKVCGARFCTARRSGDNSARVCYGPQGQAKCAKCPLRRFNNAKRETV